MLHFLNQLSSALHLWLHCSHQKILAHLTSHCLASLQTAVVVQHDGWWMGQELEGVLVWLARSWRECWYDLMAGHWDRSWRDGWYNLMAGVWDGSWRECWLVVGTGAGGMVSMIWCLVFGTGAGGITWWLVVGTGAGGMVGMIWCLVFGMGAGGSVDGWLLGQELEGWLAWLDGQYWWQHT